MSSPFSMMRRHQKVFLAIFGVICMIVFVVGDAVGTFTSFWKTGGSDPKVVTWNHGSLTARELGSLRTKHQITYRFLSDIAQQTKDKKGKPKVPFYQEDREGKIITPGIMLANSDEDLLARVLLAQQAQEMGIVISDKSVEHFLTKLSDSLLVSSDWEDILQEILVGGRQIQLTQHHVKEHLRLELAAQAMIQLQQRGLVATSPITAWEYFNRLHQRRRLELLPLKVDDYNSQVKAEPTDAEIKALYEKHKGDYPYPSLPEPGFKQRKRVAFHYLKSDFNDFVTAAMPSITDEQIQKEYDQSISRGEFKVLDLPPAEDDKNLDRKEPDGEKPAGEKSEDKKPDDAKPDDKQPDEAKPEEKKPEAKKPDDAKPDDKKPAAAPKPCSNSEGDEKDAAKTPAAADKPAADKPATEKSADEKPADEKPVDEKPTNEKPADKEKPPVKFKPIEEVRDEIVRRLAKKPAEDARTKAISDAQKEVEQFSREYRKWEFKIDKNMVKPKFDLPAVAKKVNLVGAQTELADALEIEQYELGKTSTLSFAGGSIATYTFGQIGYRTNLLLYQPERIRGEGEIEFLYWKIDEVAEFEPPLDKVRDKVVDAWKRREALKLAQKDATKKADEARDKKSLQDVFGDKVIITPAFSWLSRGMSGFGALQPSEVEGVEFPGPAFMEKAFGLKGDDVGIAENNPQSIVYVMRVAEQLPKESELRKQFLDSGVFETRGLARQDSVQTAQGWYQDLIKDLHVDWKQASRSYGNSDE